VKSGRFAGHPKQLKTFQFEGRIFNLWSIFERCSNQQF